MIQSKLDIHEDIIALKLRIALKFESEAKPIVY